MVGSEMQKSVDKMLKDNETFMSIIERYNEFLIVLHPRNKFLLNLSSIFFVAIFTVLIKNEVLLIRENLGDFYNFILWGLKAASFMLGACIFFFSFAIFNLHEVSLYCVKIKDLDVDRDAVDKSKKSQEDFYIWKKEIYDSYQKYLKYSYRHYKLSNLISKYTLYIWILGISIGLLCAIAIIFTLEF